MVAVRILPWRLVSNKNLAIANSYRQLHTQYVEGIYMPQYYNVTLKSRLRVTQGNENGTIGQIIHDLLLVELFDVKYYRDLEVKGHSRWLKVLPFESGFLFAFHGNSGRICSHFGYIQRHRMAWPWNLGLGSFKVIENGAVR